MSNQAGLKISYNTAASTKNHGMGIMVTWNKLAWPFLSSILVLGLYLGLGMPSGLGMLSNIFMTCLLVFRCCGCWLECCCCLYDPHVQHRGDCCSHVICQPVVADHGSISFVEQNVCMLMVHRAFGLCPLRKLGRLDMPHTG